MPRSHRHHALAAGLALIALFAPGRADAQCFPTPPNSIVPSHIVLVGSLGAVPESELGAFVVEARDLANNPLPGAVVAIDLSNAPDLTFCTDQLNPNLVVNCAATTVTATADAAGRAFFTLVGRGNSTGARSLLNAGRVLVNGCPAGFPTVSAYDADGTGGLGANDLANFLADFASGEPRGRSDYDGGGYLGAGDLSMWLTAFARGTQLTSCASGCP